LLRFIKSFSFTIVLLAPHLLRNKEILLSGSFVER
jgi:hypothetical protein